MDARLQTWYTSITRVNPVEMVMVVDLLERNLVPNLYDQLKYAVSAVLKSLNANRDRVCYCVQCTMICSGGYSCRYIHIHYAVYRKTRVLPSLRVRHGEWAWFVPTSVESLLTSKLKQQ